jgi:hypothetical protein
MARYIIYYEENNVFHNSLVHMVSLCEHVMNSFNLTHPKLFDKLNYDSKGENNERIKSWVCSLARSISGVERCVGAPGWGLRQVTSASIIHKNLHKPNNKLLSA